MCLFNYYSLTPNDINIEQSTSNSNNHRTFKRIKLKTSKKASVFDDFVPLQPIKAQYKGHRNARYYGNKNYNIYILFQIRFHLYIN